jgi:pyridoxine 5-phosphate synthase
MDFIRAVRPHQATFVPDSEGQSTSDHGWSFPQDAERLKPLIDECHALGVRVSLFMDPIPEQMAACKAIAADRVELYTETWASAFGTLQQAAVLAQFKATAEAAQATGLGVNAGHDLTQDNLTPFIAAMPFVAEVSIGHAFVSDALEIGYAQAVRAYKASIERAYA